MKKEIEEQRQLADDIFNCHEALEGFDFAYHSYDEGDHFMRIAKALINAGYHKTEVKTNGDYIRKSVVKSDEELAYLCWAGRWDNNANKPYFISTITHSRYGTSEEAYQANLEWLRQEYKEK